MVSHHVVACGRDTDDAWSATLTVHDQVSRGLNQWGLGQWVRTEGGEAG